MSESLDVSTVTGGHIEFLRGMPLLEHAACKGQAELFDAAITDDDAASEAEKVCLQCLDRTTCAAWLISLPRSDRPQGVCGGLVVAKAPAPPKGAQRIKWDNAPGKAHRLKPSTRQPDTESDELREPAAPMSVPGFLAPQTAPKPAADGQPPRRRKSRAQRAAQVAKAEAQRQARRQRRAAAS